MLDKLNLRHNLHKNIKISELIGLEDKLTYSDIFDSNEFDSFGVPIEHPRDLRKFPVLVLASDSFFDKMDNTWYPIHHEYNEESKKDEILFIGKILQCKPDLKTLIDNIINETFRIKTETSVIHSDSVTSVENKYRIIFIEKQYEYSICELSYQNLLSQYGLSFTSKKEIKFNHILNAHYIDYDKKIYLDLYPIDATNENIKILTGIDFNLKISDDMVKKYNLQLYVLSSR
jgi:hypothetical protein